MFTKQRSASTSGEENDTEIRKFPFRRLEQTVDRFISVLQIDIERLVQHQHNVEKYTRYGDHGLLNREHINASRTVQQLKTNLIELERTRLQVTDADQKLFDQRTARVRQDAMKILSNFMELCSLEHIHIKSIKRNSAQVLPEFGTPAHDFEELPSHSEVLQLQRTAALENEYEAMLNAERSWQRLQADLTDLNDLMLQFAKVVHEQQEALDSIEDHIDKSSADINKGTTHLSKAAKYKFALYPLAGALIGSAVGGPIGFVAGIKLGAAAAVGSGILGATGGGILKRYNTKKVDEMEMKRNSKSCPGNLDKI